MKLIVSIKTKGKTYEKSLTYPVSIEECDQGMVAEDAKEAALETYITAIEDIFGKDAVEGYEFLPEIKNDKMIEEFENES